MNRRAPKRTRTLHAFVRTLRAHLPEISEKYNVKSLGVFGSFVRHQNKPSSDLDMLVEFDKTTLHNWIECKEYLERVLKIKVDLAENKSLKPFIGRRILSEVIWLQKDGVIVDARLPRKRRHRNANLKAPTREYLDHLHTLDAALGDIIRFVGEKSFDEFNADEIAVGAVAFQTESVSGAARRIPLSVRERYADVTWNDLAEMWDEIAPHFFDLDRLRLWQGATGLITNNKPLMARVLQEELRRRADEEKDEK